MFASLAYYHKYTKSLCVRGFVMNPFDPCVWNKEVNGKQLTICFHGDDCKISHVYSKLLDQTINCLCEEYKSIFEDGTGKTKVHCGKVNKFWV